MRAPIGSLPPRRVSPCAVVTTRQSWSAGCAGSRFPEAVTTTKSGWWRSPNCVRGRANCSCAAGNAFSGSHRSPPCAKGTGADQDGVCDSAQESHDKSVWFAVSTHHAARLAQAEKSHHPVRRGNEIRVQQGSREAKIAAVAFRQGRGQAKPGRPSRSNGRSICVIAGAITAFISRAVARPTLPWNAPISRRAR